MKILNTSQKFTTIAGTVAFGGALLLSNVAFAVPATGSLTAAQQARLTLIKSKGDEEITRRLTSLTKLTDKINSASKLTAASKTTLSNEVAAAVTGLNSLKATLDAATTLSTAKTDAQQILTDYRVYALVVPKVHIVKLADGIQAVSAKLSALATKLQTNIDSAKTAGKDVASLQTKLGDMKAKIADAQSVASAVETGVLPLQPTDFNSNHQVLAGDVTKLKTAHTDNHTAFTDAKAIVSGLKNL